MPVTKKKGAIFAIYADSPSRSPTTSLPSSSPARPAMPDGPVRSPTKRSSTSTSTTGARRALSSIPPKSIGFPSATSASGLKAKFAPASSSATPPEKHAPLKLLTSVNPKPLTGTNKRAPPPTKIAPSKRQLEIFSSPAPSPTLPPAAIEQAPKFKPSTNLSGRTSASPAKRTRQTPKQEPVADKENLHPSILDSPATRTRSKVRSSSISTPSILHGSTLNKRTSDRASDEAAVVGDGRKTLTLKKGRAVAGILHGQTGDAEANGLVVKADSVLADVSEAYGAEGDEPEGFKTQGRSFF